MKLMILLFLVGLFSTGCAGAKNDFCEPCEQAARVGVDYRKTLLEAEGGNDRSLSILFRVADKLDGLGAEVYSDDLRHLLQNYGDTSFSARLSKETKKVRKNVIDSLDFAFDVYEHYADWARRFPATYRMAPHELLWRHQASQQNH